MDCDFCGEGRSTVYCRADSARLCLSCDRHVHAANALSFRHQRTLLCDACNVRPAELRCNVDNVSLCQSCDWDTHGRASVASLHKRHPFACYTGCPSAAELAELWGCDLTDAPSAAGSATTVQVSSAAPRSAASSSTRQSSDGWASSSSLNSCSGHPIAGSEWMTPSTAVQHSSRTAAGNMSMYSSMPGVGPPLLAQVRCRSCWTFIPFQPGLPVLVWCGVCGDRRVCGVCRATCMRERLPWELRGSRDSPYFSSCILSRGCKYRILLLPASRANHNNRSLVVCPLRRQ